MPLLKRRFEPVYVNVNAHFLGDDFFWSLSQTAFNSSHTHTFRTKSHFSSTYKKQTTTQQNDSFFYKLRVAKLLPANDMRQPEQQQQKTTTTQTPQCW